MELVKRKDEFDIAKALGIFCVILGHMPSVVPESIRIWIYSFHMPLFYFIAGYFSKDIKDMSEIAVFIKGKWKVLMIPYVFYSSIFLMLDVASSRVPIKQIVFEIKSILIGMQGAQWFLYGLFVVTILGALSGVIKSKMLQRGFIGVCVLIGCALNYGKVNNYFQIASSLYGVGFYYIGFCKKDILQYNLRKVIICFFISIIGGGLLSQCYSVNILDMKMNFQIDIILNYIVALSGVYVIICISYSFRNSVVSELLKHIGKNSLVYFALTWYIPGFLSTTIKNQSAVLKIVYYIVAFFVSWICVKIVQSLKMYNKIYRCQ